MHRDGRIIRPPAFSFVSLHPFLGPALHMNNPYWYPGSGLSTILVQACCQRQPIQRAASVLARGFTCCFYHADTLPHPIPIWCAALAPLDRIVCFQGPVCHRPGPNVFCDCREADCKHSSLPPSTAPTQFAPLPHPQRHSPTVVTLIASQHICDAMGTLRKLGSNLVGFCLPYTEGMKNNCMVCYVACGRFHYTQAW